MKMKLFFLLGVALTCVSAVAAEPPKPVEPVVVTLTKDNAISLNDAFWGETVANLAKRAKEMDARIPSTDTLFLVLNSPGGSIDDGLELQENLKNLKRPVTTISLFSASMGFQTVQGLGERLVTSNGTLMSHKARGGFFGEFPGQLDSRYGHYMRRVIRMDQVAVERTKGKHTLQSYHNLIENEFWCDGQDCIDQGFADKIVKPSCDKSLEGTKTIILYQDIYMGHTIEVKGDLDLCPLNTNLLKTKILIDGEPLFIDKVAVTPSPTPQPTSSFSTYFSSGYSTPSEPRSVIQSMTRDELFEINQRVQTFLNKKKNREVIRGY